jgi:hypothetical protein
VRSTRRRIPFVALCALPLLVHAAETSPPKAPLKPMASVTRHLAGPAGLRARDFDLLANYPGIPPRSLSVVEKLLRDPERIDRVLPELRKNLTTNAVTAAWKVLDIRPFEGSGSVRPSARVLAEQADAAIRVYAAPLSRAEVHFLAEEVPALLRADAEDTLLNPIEREVERLRGDATIDSVMRLTNALPRERLAEAAWWLERLEEDLLSAKNPDALRRTLDTLKASGIPVVIGTAGNDVHTLDRGIVFDPGGDDRYAFPDSARPGSWLLVIDAAGNDTYIARDSTGGATAFLSAQRLVDLAGNDRYTGLDFAFGTALMGFSRLYDAEGDDVYEARCASLGFAFEGVGILEDAGGNDTYSTAYFSQGASSTRGFGLLLDRAGDDRYVSRPVFPDDLRYRDHFLSMSQGFSSGFSPRYAGGIGALWDQDGNDAYTADIFGQGTGYWFAWGLLMDDAGNDGFTAYQYAQGAGVHFAVGTLSDRSGNDVRASKGVSQGCGHDGGFGLLVDGAGNDSTTAVDMSAGAGSANGLGVLVDFAGDDAYVMGNPRMTLGHGDMRRDKGSLGFFLDLKGRDAYSPSDPFGDDRIWRVYDGTKRGEGYGLDAQ